MSKWKHKTHKSSVQAESTSRANAKAKGPDKKKKQKKSVKKKKLYFKHVEKKQKERKVSALPPGDAQEFSVNWRNLINVLKSEQTAVTVQSGQQAKSPKPRSAAKDSHSSTHQTALNVNTAGRKPHKTSSAAAHGEKTQRPEEITAQQDHQRPPASRQRTAEKRTVKDSDHGEKINKKKKKKKSEEPETQTTEPDIWFDDVDLDDLEATLGPEVADVARKRSGVVKSSEESTERALMKEHSFDGLTNTVALDCEMVGVGLGGEESALARVSIVNYYGKCVYDKYVKPTEKVTDYRTAVSGIRPADIENGEDIRTVQKEVAEILKGRKLVGHAVHNDLKILLLDHPKKMIRDTQKYKPFKAIAKSARPALRVLCKQVLNVKVQQGEHSSVQDAQATMRLYTLVKKRWEAEIKASRNVQKNPDKAES